MERGGEGLDRGQPLTTCVRTKRTDGRGGEDEEHEGLRRLAIPLSDCECERRSTEHRRVRGSYGGTGRDRGVKGAPGERGFSRPPPPSPHSLRSLHLTAPQHCTRASLLKHTPSSLFPSLSLFSLSLLSLTLSLPISLFLSSLFPLPSSLFPSSLSSLSPPLLYPNVDSCD